jgi:hypothetical protein
MDNGAMELTLRRMAKDFLPYGIDQRLLLPPDMRQWLPEGHPALFAHDLVEQLERLSRRTSKHCAPSRVGFHGKITHGMGSSRGAAALPSNTNRSRRKTVGTFAAGKSPTDS